VLVGGGRGDVGPDAQKRVLELGAECLHVAECDGRGQKADELAVDRVLVAVDDRDRVDLAARGNVARRHHPIEGRADPAEVRPLSRTARCHREKLAPFVQLGRGWRI
jgi:hypothetical protein